MRLIDADALIEEHCKGCSKDIRDGCKTDPVCATLMWFEDATTIDAVPVVRGRWERMKAYGTQYVCSECGDIWPDFRSNYCPNCGAHMKEADGK